MITLLKKVDKTTAIKTEDDHVFFWLFEQFQSKRTLHPSI